MRPGRGALVAGLGLLALLAGGALACGSAGLGLGAGGGLALLRLPRVVAALAAGAALGLGGATQQGLFRNPLADPGLTGVFGGAMLGLATLLGFAPGFAWSHAWSLPAAAFAGALALSGLLVALGRDGPPARLLLIGLGLNAFAAAGTLLIANLAPESRELLVNGGAGDWLGMASPELVVRPALLCLVAGGLLLTLARPLDLLALGEDFAQAAGCDLPGLRRRAIVLTALAAAAATCLVGQIAFVGLLAPHLARALVGPRHHLVLPAAGLTGATLLLVADTLGRSVWPGTPISAAAVMALLGAPLFILIARRSHG